MINLEQNKTIQFKFGSALRFSRQNPANNNKCLWSVQNIVLKRGTDCHYQGRMRSLRTKFKHTQM